MSGWIVSGERELSVWGDQGGGTCLDQSISESVTLSHQHSTRSSMMGQTVCLFLLSSLACDMPLAHSKKELEILQCSSYLNTVQA